MEVQSETRPNTEHSFNVDIIHIHPWRELSALALIGLETSWLILWYEFFRHGDPFTGVGRGYLIFALNMTSAYLLARAMFLIKLRSSIRRVLLFVGYLLATTIFIQSQLEQGEFTGIPSLIRRGDFKGDVLLPIELLLVFISAYIWLRGVSFAHSWIDTRVAIRSFSFGAGMLILLGLLTVFVQIPMPFFGLGRYALSGLIALSTARAASLGRLRGGLPISFNSTWILGILISTALVVFISIVVGRVAAGDFAAWVAGAFVLLIRLLLIVGAVLVSPIILLVLISWPWFERQAGASPILQEIGRELNRLVQVLTQLLVDLSRFMQGFFESLPDIRSLKAWILGGAIAGLLLSLLIWFGQRWRLPWRKENVLQEQSKHAEGHDLRARLARAFKQGMLKLADRLGQLRLRPGYMGALRIRVLYARLMRLCVELGMPRGDTITPLEFLESLGNLFPQARREARTMTEAYNRVRYGELPETRTEVEAVEAAWQRLRAEGKRMRHVRKQLDPVGEDVPRS